MAAIGLYWLAFAFAVLLVIWAIFLLARARIGDAEYAWSASVRAPVESRSLPRDRGIRDPRDRPGNCSSCGSSIDDGDFERCWNCADDVR